MIGIAKSRIRQYSKLLNNGTLSEYNIEQTPTETSNRGTYSLRNDLCIYKKGHLESTFSELIQSNHEEKNCYRQNIQTSL